MNYSIITAKQQIKLAIADDHNLFRKALINFINIGDIEKKYTVVFEANNGIDLQEKLKTNPIPDIILMDIEMPRLGGFETVAWLQKYHPEIKILVISMVYSEEAIIRMLQMGVRGYIGKDIEVEDVYTALEDITTKGKGYHFTEYVADTVTKIIHNTGEENRIMKSNRSTQLSENEREFLIYACTDLTYMQIADKMSLSPKTIDGYREALFHKFEVKSRVSLAMHAVKHGYVKL